MKKLFIVPAIALGLMFQAQSVQAQAAQDHDIAAVTLQEEYIELATENLPQAVLDAVAKDFKGATISKAAAKEDASAFKLELTKEDGEAMEVYCDADGNWITQ